MIWGENIELVTFLSGSTSALSFTAAVFFLRFWRKTRDYFFLIFSISFLLFGAERTLILLNPSEDESRSWIYLVRLVAFLLIIIAIIQKNRRNG